MKTTRRGLFAWLGALTGAAAVSRVAPAQAEARPAFKHIATNPDWRDEYCAQLGARWAETVAYPLHKAAPAPLMCHDYPDELKPHERGEHFCSVCLTHGDRRMYEAQLRKQNARIASVAKANRGTPADFRKQFAPVRLHNEHGLTLDAGGSAFIANPPRTGLVLTSYAEIAKRKWGRRP